MTEKPEFGLPPGMLAKYLKHRDKTNEMRWLEIVEGVAGSLN
jgi:hypothetical protein